MTKLYIVQKVGYEYNDEHHYRSSDGAGTPTLAFRDRTKALASCADMNAKARSYEGEDGKALLAYEVAEVEMGDTAALTYQDARTRFNEARADARKVMEQAFKEGAQALFDQHPDLESFGWRQYTPYFNDGDSCTFGVHNSEPDVNGMGGDDEAYKHPLQKSVRSFLSGFEDNDFESLFGDHVSVTVYRSGKIVKDEYSHS